MMVPLHQNLWFKYFFFQWMFRDVNASRELYQRAAAVRHNVANRHHLLTYLKRWIALTLLTFGVGAGLETLGLMACVFFYTISALAACTISKIVAAYWMMGKLTP